MGRMMINHLILWFWISRQPCRPFCGQLFCDLKYIITVTPFLPGWEDAFGQGGALGLFSSLFGQKVF